jgi:hypothetical protein
MEIKRGASSIQRQQPTIQALKEITNPLEMKVVKDRRIDAEQS